MIHLLESYIDKHGKRKEYMLKMLLYIAYRSLWESKTPYLFSDLSNNIKTVTAATSVSDKTQNLIESATRTYLPWTNNLWDTFLGIKGKKYDTKVVILENVKNLLNHDGGKTFQRMKNELVRR